MLVDHARLETCFDNFVAFAAQIAQHCAIAQHEFVQGAVMATIVKTRVHRSIQDGITQV